MKLMIAVLLFTGITIWDVTNNDARWTTSTVSTFLRYAS